MSDPVVYAGRTHKLADDNTLCAIDHKGACLRHKRQIAHEDLVLRDLVLLLVDQAYFHLERGCVGGVSLLTFFNRVFNVLFAQLEINEFQTQMATVI